MEIRIIGANIDESQALNEHIKQSLDKSVTKYFKNAVKSEVHFKKEGPGYICTITVNEGVKGGIDIKGDHESPDIYDSFNEACVKVKTQLRRYNRKITNHRAEKHS